MKKLLALSIALLSLNLYGAEKLNFSNHGLEGWGKKEGVNIIVEDYSDLDKTYDAKAIQNQVELKLRLAGIKFPEEAYKDTIYINLHPIMVGGKVIGYNVLVNPRRIITFIYNGKEYTCVGSSKSYGGISPINYRQVLDQALDELLLNYLKANPKPKEKKSLIEP